jgi:hypothetical protein
MSGSDAADRHGVERDHDIPTIRLPAVEAHVQMIRRLQAIVLKHPLAANAVFAALIAEGLAFARTPEGKLWRDKLAGSELLHRARLLLDFPGLSILERDEEQTLPSGYLDAIFMFASGRALLDSLLE